MRSPILRLIVALVFAASAAVAGSALVHGVTREAVPSEIWRQIFCIIGGAFVFVSALMRLAGGMASPRNERHRTGRRAEAILDFVRIIPYFLLNRLGGPPWERC